MLCPFSAKRVWWLTPAEDKCPAHDTSAADADVLVASWRKRAAADGGDKFQRVRQSVASSHSAPSPHP